MRLFLIRHAESIQNTQENNVLKIPDSLVYLTEEGKKQSREAGKFLSDYFATNNIDLSKTVMYVSPYKRTRETASIINKYLNVLNVKEDIALVEHSFGLFSDKTINEIKSLYPNEFEYYDLLYQNKCEFFASLPQGESPYEVALRLRFFMERIKKEKEAGMENIVIVSHGIALKCFVLDYFNHSVEWYHDEGIMGNCAIRLILDDGNCVEDKDYIYGGRIQNYGL